jgi:hypothetical protein
MNYVDFITHISTAVQRHVDTAPGKQPRLSLRLDDTFWKKYCAPSEDEAGHVRNVLKTAPTTHIYFSLELSDHGSNLTATEVRAAFHRLCDALGSIRTIKSAYT